MDVKVAIQQLRLSFGKKEVLKGIDLDIVKNRIYGFNPFMNMFQSCDSEAPVTFSMVV